MQMPGRLNVNTPFQSDFPHRRYAHTLNATNQRISAATPITLYYMLLIIYLSKYIQSVGAQLGAGARSGGAMGFLPGAGAEPEHGKFLLLHCSIFFLLFEFSFIL